MRDGKTRNDVAQVKSLQTNFIFRTQTALAHVWSEKGVGGLGTANPPERQKVTSHNKKKKERKRKTKENEEKSKEEKLNKRGQEKGNFYLT